MTSALDGRIAAAQCIFGSIAFQGDNLIIQNDLVFFVAGFVNFFNRLLKISVRPDPMRLRHGARRRQRQHADRYAQRLPNLPVHRFLPFLRFVVFLYTACKMDTDIIAYRHSFFNLFYTVLHESQIRNFAKIQIAGAQCAPRRVRRYNALFLFSQRCKGAHCAPA